MNFFKFLFKDKKDNLLALSLVGFFCIFYIALDIRIVNFISSLGDVTNPFSTTMFKLNLFNFDPIIYYISGGGTIIHPLFSFLTVTIGRFAMSFGGNISILVISSLLNAFGVAIIYIFARKNFVERKIAYITSAIYGAISYNLITSFIPDSYVFAQFAIIVSVLYIVYIKQEESYNIFAVATLAVVNFGITITNVIPFAIGILFNKPNWKWGKYIKKIIQSICIFLVLVVVLTLIQHKMYGRSWITGWQNYLQAGGVAYSAKFDLTLHSKILRLMIASPILLPQFKLLDPGIMAVVTDTGVNLNIVQLLLLIVFGIMIIVSIVRNIKNPIMHCLMGFVIWNIFLHIGKGFGLRTFDYDMFLYAGHYISILFMILVLGFTKIEKAIMNKIAFGGLVASFIFIMTSNVIGLERLYKFIISIY